MYTLEQKLLENYAKVMVHYAINEGKGINNGETIFLIGQECSKDLYMEIYKEILRSGGNVIHRYLPDEVGKYNVNRSLLEIGTDKQLSFFPRPFWQGVTDSVNHIMFIVADPDIHALEGIPPEKVTMLESSKKPFVDMRRKKEAQGKLSWSICMYATQSMADEAGMTVEEYWEQIIEACYLRDANPVLKWKETQEGIKTIATKLNDLQIEKVHVVGKDVDLHVLIGNNRKWLGGTGHNVPSYEIFTSPDWRGTNGYISFNQPLYNDGRKISGIHLEFKDGIVTKASAMENEGALHALLAVENGNRIGEFSLTDRRHSKITRFMATTMYDENMGGEYGNTHIALGNSFDDTYSGDLRTVRKEYLMELGFNDCALHTDIISTTDRTVTATLTDGTKMVIYKNGEFTI